MDKKRLCIGLWIGLAALPVAAEVPEELRDDPHVREELGVNEFTTPSIPSILADLGSLDHALLVRARRDPPRAAFPDRAQLALNTGATIAEGFLAAAVRDRSAIEPVGRALIRQGDALGVGTRIKGRAQSLIELAAVDRWDDLREEMAAAQRDVEEALMNLRDEEIAHLISLGGWLRGAEIVSGVVAADYSPKAAENLDRTGLVQYFINRIDTLHPDLREQALFRRIDARLKEMERVLRREEPPSAEEVARIAEITTELNRDIGTPGK